MADGAGMPVEGGCLCGAVRWRLSGPPNWQGICHCYSCRKNTASPATAFIGVPLTAFEWTGAEPPAPTALPPACAAGFAPPAERRLRFTQSGLPTKFTSTPRASTTPKGSPPKRTTSPKRHCRGRTSLCRHTRQNPKTDHDNRRVRFSSPRSFDRVNPREARQ